MGVTGYFESHELVEVTRRTQVIGRGKLLVVVSGLVVVEHKAPIGPTVLALLGKNGLFSCSSRGTCVRLAHTSRPAVVAFANPERVPEPLRRQAAERHLRELSFRLCIQKLGLNERIATALAFLAQTLGTRRTENLYELPLIAQPVLGGFCCCTRGSVNEILGSLADAGMLSRQPTGFLVRLESPRVWGRESTGEYFWELAR